MPDRTMILLLAGTAETGETASALIEAGFNVLVSTATEVPIAIPEDPRVRVRKGPLDREGMEALLKEVGGCAVVDVTHPYAREISALAQGVCEEMCIPCLRFVRRKAVGREDEVIWAQDHEEASQLACRSGGPVLLTTGARHLTPYARVAEEKGVALYCRVLPVESSVRACLQAGLSEDRIIQGRGPFSVEENRALIRKTGVVTLVTKDGGRVGGVREKLEAARLEGVRVVVIRRPPEAEDNAFSSLVDLVAALKRHVFGEDFACPISIPSS